jgi:hypothetical protein
MNARFLDDGGSNGPGGWLAAAISLLFSAFAGFQNLISLPFDLREVLVGVSGGLAVFVLAHTLSHVPKKRAAGVEQSSKPENRAPKALIALVLLVGGSFIASWLICFTAGYHNIVVRKGYSAYGQQWTEFQSAHTPVTLEIRYSGGPPDWDMQFDLIPQSWNSNATFVWHDDYPSNSERTIRIFNFQKPQVLGVIHRAIQPDLTEQFTVTPNTVNVLTTQWMKLLFLRTFWYGVLLCLFAYGYFCWRYLHHR